MIFDLYVLLFDDSNTVDPVVIKKIKLIVLIGSPTIKKIPFLRLREGIKKEKKTISCGLCGLRGGGILDNPLSATKIGVSPRGAVQKNLHS